MAVRTNLVTNPSFEVNLTSWTLTEVTSVAGSTTATRSTTQKLSGTASLKLVQTTAGEDDFMQFVVACSTSTNYAISAWYYLETYTAAAVGNRGFLVFPGAGGVAGKNITDTTLNTWINLSDTINSGTSTTLNLRCYAPQGTIYWDGVLTELGVAAGQYFDGATTTPGYTYAWTGAANASSSTQTQNIRDLALTGMGA